MPRRFARVLLPALLLACTLAAAFPAACPAAFPAAALAQGEDLLESLRRKSETLHSVSADFVQESSIPLFSQPVRSFGRFVFQRPAKLRWEYVRPIREGFVLNGDKGFRWTNDNPARLSFDPARDPLAGLVARQMIAWITHDLESIGREYAIRTLPGPDLRLQMVPLRDDVRSVIAAIVITFTPEGPASLVEIREAGGGGTTIRFSNTVVNGPLDGHAFE